MSKTTITSLNRNLPTQYCDIKISRDSSQPLYFNAVLQEIKSDTVLISFKITSRKI